MGIELFLLFILVILIWLYVFYPFDSQNTSFVDLQNKSNKTNALEQNKLERHTSRKGENVRDATIKTKHEEDLTATSLYNLGSDGCTDDEDSDSSVFFSDAGYTDGDEDECDDDDIKKGDRDKKDDENEKIFQSFVDKDKLNSLMKKNGALVGLMDYIKETLPTWTDKKLNIAVTGNSGTGKSSLINALMGLNANDKGAAKVGITETTLIAEKYHFPGTTNLILWDVPGIGTYINSRKVYFSKFDFSNYELVIIVSATRFTDNDVWLAQKMIKMNKYVFFVRTKIDIDLENESHDHPSQFNMERCLETVKRDIEKNLNYASINHSKANIYIVSSRDREDYDFPEMFDRLRNLMNMKGACVCKLLQKHAQSASKKTSECMRKEYAGFFKYITVSVLSEMYCYIYICDLFEKCKSIFCQEDKILERVAKETNTKIDDLQKNTIEFLKMKSSIPLNLHNMFTSIFTGYWVFKDTVKEITGMFSKEECSLIKLRIQELEKQLQLLR